MRRHHATAPSAAQVAHQLLRPLREHELRGQAQLLPPQAVQRHSAGYRVVATQTTSRIWQLDSTSYAGGSERCCTTTANAVTTAVQTGEVLRQSQGFEQWQQAARVVRS
jgi:hypothetical protein